MYTLLLLQIVLNQKLDKNKRKLNFKIRCYDSKVNVFPTQIVLKRNTCSNVCAYFNLKISMKRETRKLWLSVCNCILHQR